MYTKRYFNLGLMYFISWRMVLWSLFTGILATCLFEYFDFRWVAIPWLPVSLIGTAVAFYVRFKNNQSYDRGWEARKVWGGIVNLSRAFGAASRAFVTGTEQQDVSDEDAKREVCRIIYRHVAWLHALKHSMWQRTPWEHEHMASIRQRNYFKKRIDFSTFETEASPCLDATEMEWIKGKKNQAAQLLDRQSQEIGTLRKKGCITELQHIELQRLITELYGEQGRTERIKNSPLPRQYSTSSAIFIIIFTLLLPFGMLNEFQKLGDGMVWLLIPFNLIVSWVFSLMEYTGDYSENPFEGLINDVPIQTIVRNIEIDLRDMLGEEKLPERVQPIYNVQF